VSDLPFFSLVIPVYNVAPYLPRCLESLTKLDPRPDEIVVVDDGSTDDCPRILADFAPQLPQMRVIRQENGGLSAARNTGLSAARGKYLAFVDSDDFLEPDAYRRALAAAETDALDMVLFNALFHYEGRKPDRPIYENLPASPRVVSGREWLTQRLSNKFLPHMVWMHLYRREFIEENRFRFIPRLIHEDVIWTTQALLAAKRVRYIDQIAIHYRIPVRVRTPAQMQEGLARLVDSSLINARTIADIADTLEDDPTLRGLLSWQAVDGAFSIFHKIEKMPDRQAALAIRSRLLREKIFSLLWQHAQNNTQRRRIARHFLVCTASRLFA